MPEFTKEDMKVLADMSVEGSVPAMFLPDMYYEPDSFRAFLVKEGCKQDAHYLFELELREVPLLINQGNISGYLKWRLAIGK